MEFSILVLAVGLGTQVMMSAPAQAATPATPSDSAVAEVPASPETVHWRLVFSPYSAHYSHSPEHRPVWMVGSEWQREDCTVIGATYFSNSFGQDSGYFYGGQRFHHFSAYDALFAQWTAGLLYGYKGQYAHKVPLNYKGFSPGLVLALGWQFTPRYSAQLNVLGNSALMFQVSANLN